jgi:hypothetical protein
MARSSQEEIRNESQIHFQEISLLPAKLIQVLSERPINVQYMHTTSGVPDGIFSVASARKSLRSDFGGESAVVLGSKRKTLRKDLRFPVS